MGSPRIVFTRFASAATPKLDSWRSHRDRVLGAAAGTNRVSPPDGNVTIWQLVSANNRELARSADVFRDFGDAHDVAREAVDYVEAESVVVPVNDRVGGGYGWYLSVLGSPALICSRWFSAERERRRAIELALTSLPAATLASTTREFAHRRRL